MYNFEFAVMEFLKKYTARIILAICLLYILFTRILSNTEGLPYLWHWDEPLVASSAIYTLKTGKFKPRNSEICYGGFLRNTCYLIDEAVYFFIKDNPAYNINSRDDIKINDHYDFRHLSHYEFYLWNRIWVSVLTTLSFLLVFLILRHIANEWWGLAGVLALMCSLLFYYNSRYATMDNPLTCVALCTLYYSILFIEKKKYVYLYAALVFGGFTLASKLSGGVVLIVPFIAWLTHYQEIISTDKIVKNGLIAISLAVTPFLVYCIVTPNLITDTAEFVKWTKYIIDQYENGRGQFTKTPGWENLSFQLSSIRENITPVIFYAGIFLSPVVIVFLFFKKEYPKLLFILPFFVFYWVYMVYMTSKTVAYERNYMVMHPVLIVIALWSFYELAKIVTAQKIILHTLVPIAFCVVLTSFNFERLAYIHNDAIATHNLRDNRSEMIDILNIGGKNQIVGIAKELKYSDVDLRKLKCGFRIFEASELDTIRKICTSVVVGNYKSFDKKLWQGDSIVNLAKNGFAIDTVLKGQNTYRDTEPVSAMAPLTNPELYLLKTDNNYAVLPPVPVYVFERHVLAGDGEKEFILPQYLPQKKYRFEIYHYGVPCDGKYPIFQVRFNDNKLKGVLSKAAMKKIVFEENSIAGIKNKITIGYYNDKFSDTQDRNLFIERIEVYE